MNHNIQRTTGFKPITLTITMDTPADALLIWATLGVITGDVRKLIACLKKEDSQRLLEAALDAPIEDTTYPMWNALDEALREAGLI